MAIDLILVKTTGTGAPVGGGSTTPDCTAPHMLDNTFWTNNHEMVWTGTYWYIENGSGPYYRLDAIGTWKNGYRPTNLAIKVYKPSAGLSINSWELSIRDTANAQIGYADFSSLSLDTVHTVNIPLTFGSNDISYITGDEYMYNDGGQIRCMIFS